MGGGDLNSKKSWHPNTMKNQENVRKAEQMAANEKKRIKELQLQYDNERDKEELNKKIKSNSGTTSDNRLHWMYDKPDKTAQQEDYLLGKAIDKNSDTNKVDEDVIPAVARRVVGSSMVTSSDDTQVDLARKIREDPLLLVKERERAARAALLNNPLHRRKLAELLRKEKVQNKDVKTKKKSKKKDKDLDDMLAKKLNAISGSKGIDLKSLLDSDDSSDSSNGCSKNKKKKKHKKKKQKQKMKSKYSPDSDEVSADRTPQSKPLENHTTINKHKNTSQEREYRKRKIPIASPEYEPGRTRNKEDHKNSTERYQSESHRREYKEDIRHRKDSRRSYSQRNKLLQGRQKDVKEQERAARLAEMAAAGAEREADRGRRVAQERKVEACAHAVPQSRPSFTEARALPDTLQNRIHSNRQYIQRDHRHMNEHFARR